MTGVQTCALPICQMKNFAGSFGFSKNQRKWERLSARGKNGKEKTAVAWLVGSHVAAVCAVVIQLKFQSDKLKLLQHQ